jgi:hypothetical protein
LISFEVITAEKSILNLEQLDSFIQAKTGFANIQMSSQLLGIESEYNYIQQNVNRYDLSEFVLNNDKVATELKKEVVVERSMVKPIIKGSDIKRYNKLFSFIKINCKVRQ